MFIESTTSRPNKSLQQTRPADSFLIVHSPLRRAGLLSLVFGTSPKLLSKVEAVMEKAPNQMGVKFKPARWY